MVVILSGPSGAGKGTILELGIELLKKVGLDTALSVSTTTRTQALTEIDGIHYNFTTAEKFRELLRAGHFAEYNIYGADYYGTPRSNIKSAVESGRILFVEIDLNGMRQIKSLYPEAVTIFVMPPSMHLLRERIMSRKRDSDTPEKIKYRISRAAEEIKCADEYDYIIVNDTLSDAVDDFVSIIKAESRKSIRIKNIIKEVLSV
jgi:guanylate kinase